MADSIYRMIPYAYKGMEYQLVQKNTESGWESVTHPLKRSAAEKLLKKLRKLERKNNRKKS